MLPNFLLEETIVRKDGTGPEFELGPASGKSLLLTLGITRIIEQESLEVSIWGSADKTTWGDKPLLSFPQKFYCGTYALTLDLSERPELRYIRVQWKVARWGRGELTPLFGVYLFAQETANRVAEYAIA